MKVLLSFFIGIGLFFNAPEWGSNLEFAKEKATTDHKLILLNFSGSDWCAPCIMLKKEVFSSDEFQSFAEDRLVLLRADFPRLKKNKLPDAELKRNEALAEKYNPDGNFPFTVLMSSKGEIIKTWNGYNGKKEEVLAEIIAVAND
jgi:thioredoxin-related protein